MSSITWNKSYSIGIKEIDEQHKRLFDIFDKLFDLTKNDESQEIMKTVTQELTDYTNYHFSLEEKYFDKFNYEEKDAHKKEHEKFVKKVEELNGMLSDQPITASVDALFFIKNWLLNHIKISDKKYADLFIKNGIK